MSLIRQLRQVREKYPDVDVCIRRDILYIDGISREEFAEKSHRSSHFLPKVQFVISYTLGEPSELIQKKGMAKVEVMAEEKQRESG